MQVVISKPNKKSVTTITGKLISDGLGWLTVLASDRKGGNSIKRFNKANISYKLL